MNFEYAQWPEDLAMMRAFIEARQEALFIALSNIAGDHWRAAAKHEGGSKEERSQYMVKVKRGKAGVALQWKRTWYVYDSKQGRHVQRSAYIKLGDGNLRHPITHFPRAKEWEVPVIESIEARMEPLREESKWLVVQAQLLSNHPILRRERLAAAAARKVTSPDVVYERGAEAPALLPGR